MVCAVTDLAEDVIWYCLGDKRGSRAAGDVEQNLWLCPVEDRRRPGATREGMLEGFSLGSYLLLVDYTSRLCRQGKARMNREAASLLDRLATKAHRTSNIIDRLMQRMDRHLFSHSYWQPYRGRML